MDRKKFQHIHPPNTRDSTNPPGWNIFNCTLTWLTWNVTGNISKINTASFQKYSRQYEKTLENILSLGFQNKFYSLQFKDSPKEGSFEYRINVSSDTPHWFVKDYLTRVYSYYQFNKSSVEDVNECAANEQNCSSSAVCENTYGGYKCVCNSSAKLEGNHCVSDFRVEDAPLAEIISDSTERNNLIMGLVLGFGIPLLLLLLIFIYCLCFKKKSGEAIIASAPDESLVRNISTCRNQSYSDSPMFYKVHFALPSQQA
ncbi:uncharacterized protein LOC142143258 [Mixophyes fleayi]|uniref:uncharacterized protein LOC142143258 n=1 Tax=Mixophyes fleayi TaxID=3061075 RepID=UPI003F4E1B07